MTFGGSFEFCKARPLRCRCRGDDSSWLLIVAAGMFLVLIDVFFVHIFACVYVSEDTRYPFPKENIFMLSIFTYGLNNKVA